MDSNASVLIAKNNNLSGKVTGCKQTVKRGIEVVENETKNAISAKILFETFNHKVTSTFC